MASGSARRDLYLNISGSATGLATAAKAGRSALAELGDAAATTVGAVEDAFAKMGGGTIQNQALALQKAYTQSFESIRNNAFDALKLPTTNAGALNLNVTGARETATQAENVALAYRELADAQARVVAGNIEATASERAAAVAFQARALAAEEDAVALKSNADAIERLQLELNAAGATSARVGAQITGAHTSMSTSSLILQHVVRATSDSFAAGMPPAQIFAQQISRVGEIVAFSGGAFGRFGAFLTGGWGIAITAGISVLAPFVAKLFEAHDAAELAKAGSDGLAEAQGSLGKIFDLTSGKLEHQNELLQLNARLTAISLRAESLQEAASSKKTFSQVGPSAAGMAFEGAAAGLAPGNGASGLRGYIRQKGLTAHTNVSNLQQLVASVQSGFISSDRALQVADTFDYSGVRVSKKDIEQAIVDAVASREKSQTADEINSSLDSGKLAPGLRRDTKSKKPKVDHTTERAANADRAYQGELNQAQDAYARAQLALSDTAEDRLAVETDELEAAKVQKDLQIDDQVKAKKINGVQADKLKQLNADTTTLKLLAAQHKEQSDLLKEQLDHDQLELDGKIALLQLQSDLAVTTKQRRDLALRILAAEEARERQRPEEILKDPTASAAQKKDAQTQINQIDSQHPMRVASVNQQNASPLDAYKTQLRADTSDMNEALQSVEVDGLKGLTDGLAGVLSGTESVSKAFKNMAASIISDLARIAIEKAIVGALGGSGGIFGSLFGKADGGQVPGKADGGLIGFASGGLPGYDAGGSIKGIGTGRSDSILAMLSGGGAIRVSNGEFITNAASTKRYLPLLHAINDNTLPGFAEGGLVPPSSIFQAGIPKASALARGGGDSAPRPYFDLRGAVMTEDLLKQMNAIGDHAAVRGAAGGAQMAQDRITRSASRRLGR